MRALAHPLRLRVLGMLRMDGPATATALGERLGEVPALVSYHLRQLGVHGFVEEAPELARDRRERWWRAAQERTSWSTAEFLDTPERRAAETALRSEVYRIYQQRLDEYLAEEPTWGAEWIEAAGSSDYVLELDPAGLRALLTDIDGIIERYTADPPQPEGEVERVQLIYHAFPRRRPS